jgi:hypothetical protein
MPIVCQYWSQSLHAALWVAAKSLVLVGATREVTIRGAARQAISVQRQHGPQMQQSVPESLARVDSTPMQHDPVINTGGCVAASNTAIG